MPSARLVLEQRAELLRLQGAAGFEIEEDALADDVLGRA